MRNKPENRLKLNGNLLPTLIIRRFARIEFGTTPDLRPNGNVVPQWKEMWNTTLPKLRLKALVTGKPQQTHVQVHNVNLDPLGGFKI
jgi:hypothetical protein